MPYQNISVEDGRSKFVQVDPNGTLNELTFATKRASVPLGNGIRVNTAFGSVTVTKKVNVAPVGEVPVYFPKSVKITFNDQSGSTASISDLLTEASAFMATARTTYNLDNGLVPPSSVAFTEPA